MLLLVQFFTISSINGVFGKYFQFLTTKMESTHTIHPQYDIMYMLTPNQWTYFPQDILHLPTLKKHQPWPNFSATHHISQCHHVCHIHTFIPYHIFWVDFLIWSYSQHSMVKSGNLFNTSIRYFPPIQSKIIAKMRTKILNRIIF